MNKTNDLVDFMHSITREMGAEYNRIQKRAAEDPGTAGDQGEENWATILRNWLPADYQIVTKGRLLSEKGIASPQIDVIVLSPFYPRHLLDKKLYLTAGVIAAFECKNTLKSSHIEKSVQNGIEIRNLLTNSNSTYREEMFSPIIYGLLAHSHSWKGENSTPIQNINDKLKEADLHFVSHPRECLDFICVSDLATWASYKKPMSMHFYEENGNPTYRWIFGPTTAFGISDKNMFNVNSEPYLNFTPIGTFLSKLYSKIALRDNRISTLAGYFGQAIGGGASLEYRRWPIEILSSEAMKDIQVNFNKYQHSWMSEG